MTERLSVIMDIVTTELQTSYKSGIPTLDILAIINRQIKTDETKHIILIDLSKAFGSVNRELFWEILYRKGIPAQLITRIRTWNGNTKLRPAAKGNLGKAGKQQRGIPRKFTECAAVRNIL